MACKPSVQTGAPTLRAPGSTTKAEAQIGRCGVFNLMQGFFSFLSGEWILRWFAPNNNGGAVILARALWVPIPCFAMLQSLHLIGNQLAGEPIPFSSTTEFLGWLIMRLRSDRSLLLTIVAGAYTALYTRFASQWQYLADLYNQIKSKEIDLAGDDIAPPDTADDGQRYVEGKKPVTTACAKSRLLSEWKYGFVVDAEHLHLSNKEPFKSVFEAWSATAERKSPASLPGKFTPSNDCGDRDAGHRI